MSAPGESRAAPLDSFRICVVSAFRRNGVAAKFRLKAETTGNQEGH